MFSPASQHRTCLAKDNLVFDREFTPAQTHSPLVGKGGAFPFPKKTLD
jgi:hypothetical protein